MSFVQSFPFAQYIVSLEPHRRRRLLSTLHSRPKVWPQHCCPERGVQSLAICFISRW
jgi:hypothetical protein